MVLGQIATGAKSNEITAVPELLRMLSLKNTIVTVDALNCQHAIAAQIVEQTGDYALALKGNQPSLHAVAALFLDDPEREAGETHTTVDAGNGRDGTMPFSANFWLLFEMRLPCRRYETGTPVPNWAGVELAPPEPDEVAGV